MFPPIRKTAPSGAPITLGEAKAHCRVDFNDDDLLIESLIQAATQRFDGYYGILCRCLVDQVWQQKFDVWVPEIRLPFTDCSEVLIKYVDALGAEQTVSSSEYEVLTDTVSSFVKFKSAFYYPSIQDENSQPITVEFKSGYGSDSDVPEPIKSAILLMIGHLYENREAVGDAMSELPIGVDMLTAPYRRIWV